LPTKTPFKTNMNFFDILAEESPNMIFINYKGKIVYANKKCEEVMGYTRSELYSDSFNFHKLLAPQSIEITNQAFTAHEHGKEVSPYEYLIKTKSGKIIDAIITTKLIKVKNENAILGVVTDISRQKETERKLFDSKQDYHTTIDSLADLIHVIDRKLRITLTNDAFKNFEISLGLNSKIEGKTIFQAFPFLPRKKIIQEYNEVLGPEKL